MSKSYIHIPNKSKWIDGNGIVWICYVWMLGFNASRYEVIIADDPKIRFELTPDLMKEKILTNALTRVIE